MTKQVSSKKKTKKTNQNKKSGTGAAVWFTPAEIWFCREMRRTSEWMKVCASSRYGEPSDHRLPENFLLSFHFSARHPVGGHHLSVSITRGQTHLKWSSTINNLWPARPVKPIRTQANTFEREKKAATHKQVADQSRAARHHEAAPTGTRKKKSGHRWQRIKTIFRVIIIINQPPSNPHISKCFVKQNQNIFLLF